VLINPLGGITLAIFYVDITINREFDQREMEKDIGDRISQEHTSTVSFFNPLTGDTSATKIKINTGDYTIEKIGEAVTAEAGNYFTVTDVSMPGEWERR
jgi:hypothetical protein